MKTIKYLLFLLLQIGSLLLVLSAVKHLPSHMSLLGIGLVILWGLFISKYIIGWRMYDLGLRDKFRAAYFGCRDWEEFKAVFFNISSSHTA